LKKILITGANSYIGVSFENYIKDNFSDQYVIDTVDTIDGKWEKTSFFGYDSVFHVAGLAHQRATDENADMYYKINRDLAIKIAQKAKDNGVNQFVFMSSMSVYGVNEGVIKADTVPTPTTDYGKSKLQAEEGIKALESESFKICILRPPMVYGLGCKGNFKIMLSIVKKYPFFPRINNKRSMVYIDNLCAFVEFAIKKDLSGLFFPQNKEYMNTTNMAKWMGEAINKKNYMSFLLGIGVYIIKPFLGIVQKAFGTLIYDDTEVFDYNYCVTDLQNSVKISVTTKGKVESNNDNKK